MTFFPRDKEWESPEAKTKSGGARKTIKPFIDISNGNETLHLEHNEEFLLHFSGVEEVFPADDVDACNRAMRIGSFEKAVHRLRDIVTLSVTKRKGRNSDRDEVGLQIAVISSALARMVEC